MPWWDVYLTVLFFYTGNTALSQPGAQAAGEVVFPDPALPQDCLRKRGNGGMHHTGA